MTNYKILSLDESGKASYNHQSELFILSGIVTPEKFKTKLDSKMRNLKKKYFQNEEIIFHSRDMSRRKGPFSLLRDPNIEVAFWSEFISIVNNPEISLYFVIADKKNAKDKGWQAKTILKRTYLKMLEEFAKRLVRYDNNGKIIAESDPSQDLFLIYAHNRMQGMGSTDGIVSAIEYRRRITSLSLVNKSNMDADIQIADGLAVIAGTIYKLNSLTDHKMLSDIEKMKKRLIDRKLINKSNQSIFEIII